MKNIVLNSQSVLDSLLTKEAEEKIAVALGRDYRNYIDRLKQVLIVKNTIPLAGGTTTAFDSLISRGDVGDAYVFKITSGQGTATIQYINVAGESATASVDTGNSILCVTVDEEDSPRWIVITDDKIDVEVINNAATFDWNRTLNLGSVQGHAITLATPQDPALNTVGQVTLNNIDVLEEGTAIGGSAKKKLRLPIVYIETTGSNKGLRMKYWSIEGTESTEHSITVATLEEFLRLLDNSVLITTKPQELSEQQKEQVLTNLGIQGSGSGLETRVAAIEDKIPAQASSTNQLADKDFVNSSVATNTGDFKGTYQDVSDLPTTNVKNNDYAFVITLNEGDPSYIRYKYVVNEGAGSWQLEYTLNNSSFTAAQWAAIQSGITEALVKRLSNLPNVPNDISMSQTDATFVYKDPEGNLKNLFYLKQATSGMAGVMTATDKNKLDSVPTPSSIVTSTTMRNIVTLTQAEFDALTTYDANTIYNVI